MLHVPAPVGINSRSALEGIPVGAAANGVPRKEDMYNPLLQALRDLGGSGTIDEIAERVITALKVPEEVASQLHDPEYSNETELEYRLAWARTYLKNYGILERSGRGVWALKADKQAVETVDPVEVNRFVHALNKPKPNGSPERDADDEAVTQVQDPEAPDAAWRQTLHRVLTTVLSPDAFERLAMRLLRESGFVHAEVTGRSGDGGIDGKGIARMAGVLSFHVVFQCKRYQGAVSSSQVRDFRGAMVGRADKGLLITTGRFSRDAIAEATREGAPPIDLIDGDRLADMLKVLKLGVRTELVERVVVDEGWLGSL